MRSLLSFSVTLILLEGTVSLAPVSAQGKSESAPSQGVAPPSYPETREGLQQQIQDLFVALRSGQEEQVNARLQALNLPNPGAWFTRVFGAQEGARIAAQYEKQRLPTDPDTRKYYESQARKEGAELQIECWPDKKESAPEGLVKALLAAMTQPVTLCSAVVAKTATSPYPSTLGYFFYVDGHFREVGSLVLSALSTAPPVRIRVGGQVQQAALVNKVAPHYPLEAVQRGIQGTVRLQAVISLEGAVAELKILSGDPVLGAAALEAVRQWRYKPTLLNGRPVEVVTVIDVVFTLSR